MADQHEQKEFDGIIQAGNDLPAWYKHLFVYMIFIGIGYGIYFHAFSSWGTKEYYAMQVAEHEAKFPKPKEIIAIDGANPMRGDTTAISEGEKNFKNVCSACHGVNGEGVVGPSLIDKEWIHGNSDELVFINIMKGIAIEQTKLGRGPMPAHDNSLGSEKVYQVMAWLASKNDTLVVK